MKIGVYVGSFNPIHIGHISLVKELLKRRYLEKVIVIPTQKYWDKQDLEDMTHRINMIKYYETNNIIVDSIHNKYIYTYEILNQIQKENINDEIFLIIGSDNVKDFHKWKNIEKLLNYKIIVIPRDNLNIIDYINEFDKKENFILASNIKSLNISSTKIRNLILNKKSVNKYLDKKVFDYIKNNKLYINKEENN